MTAQAINVAGVDGCKAGWVVAFCTGSDPIRLDVLAHISDVVEAGNRCDMIGIDMPIALPATGTRESDHALRAHLGAAARSLFWTPTRDALAAKSHAEAVTINKASGGKGPSIQGWGLAAKIREVRSAVSQAPIREVHPESSFAMMARMSGLDEPLASKKSGRGVGQRLELLREHCAFDPAALAAVGDGTVVDDCLDAVAAAWTAGRAVSGTAIWFGPDDVDDEGFVLGVPV